VTEQRYPGLELWPEAMQLNQLFIMLHGVGAQAADLVALAEDLMDEFPQAGFFLPEGTYPYDMAESGRQWYSNSEISDALRVARVAAEMNKLHGLITYAQEHFKVLQTDTALLGFSQGANMALQFCVQQDGLVGRVLAFSGRFPALPQKAPELTTLHLLHGERDSVIAVAHAQTAYDKLKEINGDVTLDIIPGLGHEINQVITAQAIHRLKTTIPLRTWNEAMKGA
jgi:phospholipase/carboxylesterase